MSYASSRLSRFSRDLSAVNERFSRRFSQSFSVSMLSGQPQGTLIDGGSYAHQTCATLGDSVVSSYLYNQLAGMNDIIHEEDEHVVTDIPLQQDIVDSTEL